MPSKSKPMPKQKSSKPKPYQNQKHDHQNHIKTKAQNQFWFWYMPTLLFSLSFSHLYKLVSRLEKVIFGGVTTSQLILLSIGDGNASILKNRCYKEFLRILGFNTILWTF
jgi:dolichol kinase